MAKISLAPSPGISEYLKVTRMARQERNNKRHLYEQSCFLFIFAVSSRRIFCLHDIYIYIFDAEVHWADRFTLLLVSSSRTVRK